MQMDFWYYIQQQDLKIKQLEQRLARIEEQFSTEARTRIDRIEYHFDQLKIEQLDGVLQIGISPDDIENFIPHAHEQTKELLHSDMVEYLPSELDQLAAQYNLQLTNNDKEIILSDLYRQMPNRIQYYQNKQLSLEAIKTALRKDLRQSLSNHFEKKVDDNDGGS
ncbi:spore germination protein PC [Amphibacillus marinus]|uniref:Spore germination protein PC n=1 Tax=Amphibacillus marinus TaxID=872970 RepID=A0A1H8Q6V1_9BACI|nr:spore germination protein GerPC [Amphibacillus marinus]SEO49972.1 spore germination protein PC [Amphibacillus marinus]